MYIVNFLPFRAFKIRHIHNINAPRAFGGFLEEEMEKAFCPGYQPRASAWLVSLPEFWGSPVLASCPPRDPSQAPLESGP